MIVWFLRHIFTVIRFVQLEWISWRAEQERSLLMAGSPEAPTEVAQSAALTEEQIIAEEIRERVNGRPTMLTDQQIRNASIAFVEARKQIKERDAALKERMAARR